MNETQRIPVVALTMKEKGGNFNEFDISFKVREKGWVLSAYTMPPNAEEINSLRIVVRPHLNRTVVKHLAHDVIEACDYLKEHGGTATPPKLHKHSSHKC
jgi:glutamate decarboxylase